MIREATTRRRGEDWSGWVGEPMPVPTRSGGLGERATSVATLALLWLSVAVLVSSGYFTTVVGENGVPGWQLAGLALLALGVVGLAVVFSTRRQLIGIGAIFGSVMVVPWLLAGLSGEVVESDGAVTIVIALVVVAIISGSGVASPHVLRLSVLVILVVAVWVALLMGVTDLLGADTGAFHFANERRLLGMAQLRGFLGHPNSLALLVSMAAVVSLQFTRSAARSGRMDVAIPAALLGPVAAVVVVIMTQSRIGLAGLLVGVALVLIPLRGRGGRIWSWVLISVLYLASFVPPVLASVTVVTFNGRASAWDVAVHFFEANPVTGVGPDAFVDLPRWLTPDWAPGHAHSQVLQSASRAGIVGVALLAISVGIATWIAIRARDFDHVWSFGVVGVFATFASLEPVLGVSAVPITLLPVVLLSCVLGSAFTLGDPSARVVPRIGSVA